jgi:L-fuculose-phosphate aldolase
LECYRQREDVHGVVHAHPQTVVAMSITGYDFQRCILAEAVVILGLVPTTPYATPASPENRDTISALVQEYDAIVLAHHGSLTVAGSVWDAYLKLETLEHSARILFMAEQLGNVRSLPPHQVEKLLAIRTRLGCSRPGDIERFKRAMELTDEEQRQA